MRAFTHLIQFLLLVVFLMACSTSSVPEKKDSRAPASIGEVVNYLKSSVLHPIAQIKNRGPNYTKRADINNDGIVDSIHSYKNYRLVVQKLDRNFDGDFDYIKRCKNGECRLTADDDFNKSFERRQSLKLTENDKVMESYSNSKSKTKYKIIPWTSMANENSEGQSITCVNCQNKESEFIAEETCEEDPDDFFAATCTDENSPRPQGFGLQKNYVDIFKDSKKGPSLLVSETCEDNNYSIDQIVKDSKQAINTLVTCFDKKINSAKEQGKFRLAQGAQNNLELTENLLVNKNNPLKINCGTKEKYGYPRAVGLNDQTNEINKQAFTRDEQNSVVLVDSQENQGRSEMQSLIIHELLHLIHEDFGPHGLGTEKFSGCAFDCMGNFPGDPKVAETNCYSEFEILEGGKASLDPAPYSHLTNTAKMLEHSYEPSTLRPLLIMQLNKEFEAKPGRLTELQQNAPEALNEALVKAMLRQYQGNKKGYSEYQIRSLIEEQKGKTFDESKIEEYGTIMAATLLINSISLPRAELLNKLGEVDDFPIKDFR